MEHHTPSHIARLSEHPGVRVLIRELSDLATQDLIEQADQLLTTFPDIPRFVQPRLDAITYLLWQRGQL